MSEDLSRSLPPHPSGTVPDLSAVTISERLEVSLRALGAAGESWLAGLPGLLASLAADWSVTIGARLDGGHAAYVAEAVMEDGTPAVLKVPVPPGVDGFTPFERQLTALRLAGGDPYVALIRHDEPRQALLLERLGRPMAHLGLAEGWPAARKIDELARTAARGWRPVSDDGSLPNGVAAARWFADFIPATWEELGRPCPEEAVDLAVRCAAAREAAYDPGRAVLVHGDVHAYNALEAPGGDFRLVDAEGLVSEPAHDLGVIQVRGVEGWLDLLAARDPQHAFGIAMRRCERAGQLAGADPEAIWQWMFTETVSTGLFLLSLGHASTAEPFLTAAGNLASATASTGRGDAR
jgi:streptomycin 6-kinase